MSSIKISVCFRTAKSVSLTSKWGTKGTYTALIYLVVCLTTVPNPLPKRALHIVRSRVSSFKWEYPLFSLRSSNSFLHLLPCLPVTSILPCIFLLITRCRRQFLLKMWPIQFAFRLRISCRIFLCSLYGFGKHKFRIDIVLQESNFLYDVTKNCRPESRWLWWCYCELYGMPPRVKTSVMLQK